MHFTIHTDGGARGNPGTAGAGAIIRDELGSSVASVSKYLGKQTNNFAEYEAVILALISLTDLIGVEKTSVTDVIVKMDSELIVKQVKKEYRVKHPVLKEQYARLTKLIDTFKSSTFIHVPREQNKDADALANEAMDRGI